jgi:hypothetical protein
MNDKTLKQDELQAGDRALLELRKLVKRHRICWEVFPEYMYVDQKRLQIGFQLELIGTHEIAVDHPEPGCVKCQDVFGALKVVAGWILPKEERPSEYEIGVFDDSIHYSARRRNRPDVILSIRIMHRNGFAPVDPCEERCLKEMQQKLSELGATQQHWIAQENNLQEAPGGNHAGN